MKNQNELTAIIGAKGKTGRRVVERLKGRGLAVRELSRSTELPFDWNDESTWPSALAGVSAVYVTYSPDLAAPGATAHVEQLCHFLKGTEVRRIVLLAGRGEPQVHPAERAGSRKRPRLGDLGVRLLQSEFQRGSARSRRRRDLLSSRQDG